MTSPEDMEIWKMKKLIRQLSLVQGNGTSMISLIISAGTQISQPTKLLITEYGAANNIRSRVNRSSVQSAITSAQQKLKLYKNIPENGLVIYCGTIKLDTKEKKLCIDFVPFKPIKNSLYMCDSRFHLDPLNELTMENEKFGFIIIDGNGLLLANVFGNNKEILHTSSVHLPGKTRRGGQSALRFSRLRMEARHNYMTKSIELIKRYFTKNNKAIVSGIIIAGNANLKKKLYQSDLFPVVLKKIVIKIFDISYGGINGLGQAISRSKSILSSVKLMNEKKIIGEFFEHIAKDTGLYCFGTDEILYVLEMGAINKLIIDVDSDIMRYEMDDGEVICMNPDRIKPDTFKVPVKSKKLFIEWILENYSKYGVEDIYLVSNNTTEGHQFCTGFGGLGSILRWKVELSLFHEEEEDLDDFM